MATIAGFASALPAGLVGLHGTLKSLDSTIRAFRSSYNGFEFNMSAAEGCYKTANAVVDRLRANPSQIGARILQTAFGEITNSFSKGSSFLDMAVKDLNKIDDKANDVVTGLNNFITQSTAVSQTIASLKTELATLKSSSEVSPDKVQMIEENIAKITNVLSIERDQYHYSALCTQSTFVNGCTKRIRDVQAIEKKCKASDGAEAFIKVWDALELVAGVLGGGFADGGGFTGEKLVNGLNPINDNDWITIGNFAGHTGATLDTLEYANEIRKACRG